MFPGPKARTSSSSAEAGRIYKKVQDLFGQTQGAFNFDGTFTGNDFADFLLGNAKSYNELAVQDQRPLEQRFVGRIRSGQLARESQA